MAEPKPVHIISDSPEKETSHFGFDAYAKTIADLIAFKDNKTPMVIGIYGPWGAGKTTLMETVRSFLKKEEYQDKEVFRKCKTIWFQAWKYSKEEEILAALIEEIFKTMAADNFFEECKAEIEKLTKKLKLSKIVEALSKLFTGMDVTEFFSDLKYREKLGFYDTFQLFFTDLIWTYLNWRAKINKTEKPDDQKGALVIFIDDLDRCPRPRIINVLETIKLFMDKQGCIFVIGAAGDIIEKALKDTYGDDAAKFMDKIVQVTFNLPQITNEDFEFFIKEISPDIEDDLFPHLPLILPTMKSNPRQFKRFLNNLHLQEGLHRNRGNDIAFRHILLWNIIDYIYPMLREDIKDNPNNLHELKNEIQKIKEQMNDSIGSWNIPAEMLEKVPQSFQKFVQQKALVDIILSIDISTEQLSQLVTMSSAVESAEILDDKKETGEHPDFDSMVKIPAGVFLYGDDKKEVNIEKPFFMDVYPVTNVQYKKFIEGGGYDNDKFWSDKGIEWKKSKGVSRPRYWDDEKWTQPDCPVVGVTYYEAEAYAEWAGKRLPTEQEWERAARGTKGIEYPWGDAFDKDKCNSKESNIGKTTRVTRYPTGRSPEGCYDMAGNVWEWTDSWYDSNKNTKTLRGGGWFYNSDNCRCAARVRNNPDLWDLSVGFRCART